MKVPRFKLHVAHPQPLEKIKCFENEKKNLPSHTRKTFSQYSTLSFVFKFTPFSFILLLNSEAKTLMKELFEMGNSSLSSSLGSLPFIMSIITKQQQKKDKTHMIIDLHILYQVHATFKQSQPQVSWSMSYYKNLSVVPHFYQGSCF